MSGWMNNTYSLNPTALSSMFSLPVVECFTNILTLPIAEASWPVMGYVLSRKTTVYGLVML